MKALDQNIVDFVRQAVQSDAFARYLQETLVTLVNFNTAPGQPLGHHLRGGLRATGKLWRAGPEAFLAEDDAPVIGDVRASPHRHARAVDDRVHFPLAFETREHLAAAEREEFEAALLDFRGAIVAVSHDRRFIERFADQVWEMREGRLARYLGGWRDT